MDFSQLADPEGFNYANTWGYGFSFVYRKSLWKECPFEEINAGEDTNFVKHATALGKELKHIPDVDHLVLHIIHRSNCSKIFPQISYRYESGVELLDKEAINWLSIR